MENQRASANSSVMNTPEQSPSRLGGLSKISSLSLEKEGSSNGNASDDLPSVPRKITATLIIDGKQHKVTGDGNGPLSSFLDALSSIGIELSVREYSEHSIGVGSDVKAATYIEVIPPNVDPKNKTKGGYWGVGVDADITASGLKAVVSAANCWLGDKQLTLN
ncbi:2-isopropylmalate synthase [Trichosporon asahii var. asahii CBS 8904]|uniref:2-isopropylmalate synthase n=2 Tax=Trichosporon asahii var. asahii TaxID=189963 RepID=K1VWS9_TRIAC|nr:2-isopropylmalate synthase [Trichosporon asahii var. asahii CBS 8904]